MNEPRSSVWISASTRTASASEVGFTFTVGIRGTIRVSAPAFGQRTPRRTGCDHVPRPDGAGQTRKPSGRTTACHADSGRLQPDERACDGHGPASVGHTDL